MLRVSLIALVLILVAGCASTVPNACGLFVVEGVVSVRGNEPFTALMVETDSRHSYVLDLADDERAALQNAAPGRFQVEGYIEPGTWAGRPYTHLRVTGWDAVE